MRNSNRKTLRTVQLAMLVALVVVLQIISASVPPIGGMVSITLTLVPVVVGAILFGVKGGAILGASFGLIVLINCIIALDRGGNFLWTVNPFYTSLICLVKGVAAGVIPAWTYRLINGKREEISAKQRYGATMVSALFAPVVNTGLFVCGMLIFFQDALYAWAGGTPIVSYILFVLAGLNFLVEFLINIFLTPAIVRIVDVVKKN